MQALALPSTRPTPPPQASKISSKNPKNDNSHVQVLALMGPSGSGKSSLLATLGGRSTARTTGSITFNGQPLTKAVKRKLGYVTQDDLLYAEVGGRASGDAIGVGWVC